MPRLWVDANVFIEANNSLTSLDLMPDFWAWIETKLKQDQLCSSRMVYNELLGKDDRLADWARTRRESPYWHTPNQGTQRHYRAIVKHVSDTYGERPAKVADFLSKADCWIIAHAKDDNGTVVTRETKVDQQSLTPKIPNVCEAFEVPFIDAKAMLERLNFSTEYARLRMSASESPRR